MSAAHAPSPSLEKALLTLIDPVIILRRLSERSDHVLVTTVSAYGARKDALDPVAPWNQPRHEREDSDFFRSFEGSERANPNRPHLSLRAGQQFRKAITNWVDVRNAYVVPLGVLVPFATSTQGVPLQMRPESCAELSADMRARCPTWDACRWKLSAAERALPRLPPTPPPTPPLSPALSLDSEDDFPSLPSSPTRSKQTRSAPAQVPAAVSPSKTDTTAVDPVPATPGPDRATVAVAAASAAEVTPSTVAPVSAKRAFWSQVPPKSPPEAESYGGQPREKLQSGWWR